MEITYLKATGPLTDQKDQANRLQEETDLVNKFNSWLMTQDRVFSELSRKEIIGKLYDLGMVGEGPITPETWAAGSRPVNPLALQDALEQLYRMNNNAEEPLLPPGVGVGKKDKLDPQTWPSTREEPLIPASVRKFWEEQKNKK